MHILLTTAKKKRTTNVIQELNSARDSLYAALGRYVSACSAVKKCCLSGTTSDGTPQLKDLVRCADNELGLFKSYKVELKKAKAAMGVARNCSSTLVPIHALPSEILSRIFQLVLDAHNCIGEDVLTAPINFRSNGPEFPKYPDLLSIVCYHWRQVAIGSAALWSHIDIVPDHHFSERLLTRANGYAARAGQSLLNIHIVNKDSSRSDGADIVQFLRSVATRMQSLELVAPYVSRQTSSLLHYCFVNCIPGIFTQLRIKLTMWTTSDPHFIQGHGGTNTEEDLPFKIPQHSLEKLWSGVTFLRLNGLYPHWTSSAYRGLVELHLFSPGTPSMHITESQLVNILLSSPRLHTLWFNLRIIDTLPDGASISPIHLNNLEVLNVQSLYYDQLGVFLRWLSPGQRPLRLALRLPPDVGSKINFSMDRIKGFLGRSNVSEIYLVCLDTHIARVTEVLQLTPFLRVLALDCLSSLQLIDAVPEQNVQAPSLSLDHLYMLECMFDLELVQILGQMISARSFQHLTVWDCSYYHDANSYPDERALKHHISSIYPTAQFLARDEPSPTKNWDFLA